jgi:hypothetical protein
VCGRVLSSQLKGTCCRDAVSPPGPAHARASSRAPRPACCARQPTCCHEAWRREPFRPTCCTRPDSGALRFQPQLRGRPAPATPALPAHSLVDPLRTSAQHLRLIVLHAGCTEHSGGMLQDVWRQKSRLPAAYVFDPTLILVGWGANSNLGMAEVESAAVA